MIHWAWTIFAFAAGAIFGIFLIALAEVSRGHDDEGKHKGWYE